MQRGRTYKIIYHFTPMREIARKVPFYVKNCNKEGCIVYAVGGAGDS